MFSTPGLDAEYNPSPEPRLLITNKESAFREMSSMICGWHEAKVELCGTDPVQLPISGPTRRAAVAAESVLLRSIMTGIVVKVRDRFVCSKANTGTIIIPHGFIRHLLG
jgi:hypothetical protein